MAYPDLSTKCEQQPIINMDAETLGAFNMQVHNNLSPHFVMGIRIGVKGGSCEGLTYYIGFEYDGTKEGDIVWPSGDWWFFVDKKSATYLSGSTLTWKKTLMKEGFEFTNPNEASRCGCGSSFSVNKQP